MNNHPCVRRLSRDTYGTVPKTLNTGAGVETYDYGAGDDCTETTVR